jgi:hypothetical protein
MKKFLEKGSGTEEECQKSREFVIAEIMATEKAYFDKLQALLDVYITPLENLKIISDEDLAIQFNGLKKIHAIHFNMYMNMFEYSDSREINIPDLFAEFVSKLSEYQDYLINYNKAIARRGVLQTKNKNFSAFIKNASNDIRCFDNDFESLLIAPVQRIPRYRLLLEDLLKYTSAKHPQYQATIRALEKIKEVANQNNEAMRQREKREELMKIMMKIDESSRIDLLENPNRYLIRQGTLRRQCRYVNQLTSNN